jgi:hypothetical protein
MTAEDRVRGELIFISPRNKRFSANWIGDPAEKEKSLGLKKYPGIDGVFVQDQGTGGVGWPLNFFFDGPDHDLEAAAFFQATDEIGTWRITHPVDGDKNLFLVSVRRDIQPVTNGGLTNFSTNWIQSIARERILSRAATPEDVAAQTIEINNAAADEFDNKITQETETQKEAVRTTSRSLLTRIRAALAGIYELSNEINSQVNAIQSAINSTLNEFILRPLALAAQFQQLIQLPALAVENIQRRLAAYRELAESIFELSPETIFPRDLNIAACLELNLTATLAAASQSLVTGPLTSRLAALENSNALLELFDFATDGLDNIEQLFKDLQADRQFLTQVDVFALLGALTAQAVDSTVKTSFDLRIEKRFVLDRARAPIEITIAEYGDLGENDSNLDLFNDTNLLQGDELTLLPAGKEVVVYV